MVQPHSHFGPISHFGRGKARTATRTTPGRTNEFELFVLSLGILVFLQTQGVQMGVTMQSLAGAGTGGLA